MCDDAQVGRGATDDAWANATGLCGDAECASIILLRAIGAAAPQRAYEDGEGGGGSGE